MAEGFEVVIRYRGAKYDRVASPPTPSAAFAILKKDLAHLRVHSPSQKNVRRINGSFALQWPTAIPSSKDSLHTRWLKLCGDDPEAHKLREFLSIESITLMQDGVLIHSTSERSQDAPRRPPAELVRRPAAADAVMMSTATLPAVPSLPSRPSFVLPSPPSLPSPLSSAPAKVPPTVPKMDRQLPPHLTRPMSVVDGSPGTPEVQLPPPALPTPTELQRTSVSASPRADRLSTPATPNDRLPLAPALPLLTDDVPMPAASPPPQVPVATPAAAAPMPMTAAESTPIPLPLAPRDPHEALHTPRPPGSRRGSPGLGLRHGPGSRPPSAFRPSLSTPSSTAPRPASPYTNSGGVDAHQLTRELWDTRRQLTALRAREKVIMNDLEKLGIRPDSSPDPNDVLREELARLEADLKAEQTRRARAEQALSDVERECRAPFVVPALFQAFMSISELSS